MLGSVDGVRDRDGLSPGASASEMIRTGSSSSRSASDVPLLVLVSAPADVSADGAVDAVPSDTEVVVSAPEDGLVASSSSSPQPAATTATASAAARASRAFTVSPSGRSCGQVAPRAARTPRRAGGGGVAARSYE